MCRTCIPRQLLEVICFLRGKRCVGHHKRTPPRALSSICYTVTYKQNTTSEQTRAPEIRPAPRARPSSPACGWGPGPRPRTAWGGNPRPQHPQGRQVTLADRARPPRRLATRPPLLPHLQPLPPPPPQPPPSHMRTPADGR